MESEIILFASESAGKLRVTETTIMRLPILGEDSSDLKELLKIPFNKTTEFAGQSTDGPPKIHFQLFPMN